MTFEQIEAFVQVRTDSLDRAYMNRTLSEEDYQFLLRALDRWAERKMRLAPKAA